MRLRKKSVSHTRELPSPASSTDHTIFWSAGLEVRVLILHFKQQRLKLSIINHNMKGRSAHRMPGARYCRYALHAVTAASLMALAVLRHDGAVLLSTPLNSIPIAKVDGTGKLHVVVAHCDKRIDWIWNDFLRDVELASMTIITKCGQPPDPTTLPVVARVVELPNVGRCDHSYAYFIQNMKDLLTRHLPLRLEDEVIFMKDNDNTYRDSFENAFSFQEMRNMTQHKRFACASAITEANVFHPGEKASNVVEKYVLAEFRLDIYAGARLKTSNDFVAPVRPLVKWLEWLKKQNAVNLPMNHDLVPVCFGGNFMTTVESILRAPVGDWNPVVQSLSRGDNIEEGHYMERM